jgi:hypothetical protein
MTMALVVLAGLGGCDASPTGQEPTTSDEFPDASIAVPDRPEELAVPASPRSTTSPTPSELPAEFPPALSDEAIAVTRLPSNLDLIPSTNADQRVQAIQTERSDPFSQVPTAPSVQIEITSEAPSPEPSPAVSASTNQPTGGQSTAANGGGNGSGGLIPLPPPAPRSSAAPVAAAPPQPSLAQAVQVLGVMQIGEVPYAIVNAPNEPSSRYVREGERLANGQVMVRRIDLSSAEPAVVFEEDGMEVITSVGSNLPPAGSPMAEVAIVEPPPS